MVILTNDGTSELTGLARYKISYHVWSIAPAGLTDGLDGINGNVLAAADWNSAPVFFSNGSGNFP
ncbi:MAG: hypothetical protein JSV44_06090, partial [Candidatus Zixiibacteriota bacterium]